MALAVVVEFVQLYFPQRSVTLNDILAECIGSLLGVLLMALYPNWLSRLIEALTDKSMRALLRGLEAFALAYVAYSLFPYDFLVSRAEFADKVASSSWGWVVAGDARGLQHAGLQAVLEVALTIPIGALLALCQPNRKISLWRAATIGVALGLGIELAQWFMASGVSQGLSVATRVAGVLAGAALANTYQRDWICQVQDWIRRFTIPLALVQIVGLIGLNGFFSSHWVDFDNAIGKLSQLNFLPFYYHYFTSEARAIVSLAVVCISYLPVALLARANRRSDAVSATYCAVLALCIEGAKLFVESAHPDPTNILLAGVSGWLGHRGLSRFDAAAVPSVALSVASNVANTDGRVVRWSIVWTLGCLGVVIAAAAMFPAFAGLVVTVLLINAAALWLRPVWVFMVVPGCLPIFDLAPWTGRFYLDEFDMLLATGLLIAYVRHPAPKQLPGRRDWLFGMVALLMALSFAIGAVRGILPLQLPDENAFNTYFSPYNALRIGKGAVWGFLFYALLRRYESGGLDPRRYLAWGMVAGLFFTVVFVLWERVAFTGLWNFSSDYRVTGPFSAMHVGGAYIEGFLVVATPFLFFLALEKRNLLFRASCLALLLATTYAVMVTFSRNGYFAFAVVVAIALLSALLQSKRRMPAAAAISALCAGMALVASPVFFGSFAQSRVAMIDADLQLRLDRWNDSLAIRDPGFLTGLFGMGLGRFPETSFWRSTVLSRPGTYRVEAASGNHFLRLAPGNPIYIEQIVSVQPDKQYVLRLDARPNQPNATLIVPICEIWMLTSYNCIRLSLDLGKESGVWRHFEIPFTSDKLSAGAWYSQRPVKLALFHPGPKSTIDVDNLSLQTAQGAELLRNGDFAGNLDHWFFVSDSYSQWHVNSLFYGVLFDQGWFGLAVLLALLVLAALRALTRVFHGDAYAAASLAALAGFVTVGAFDTLIDAPRFLMLFVLLSCLCMAGNPTVRAGGR